MVTGIGQTHIPERTHMMRHDAETHLWWIEIDVTKNCPGHGNFQGYPTGIHLNQISNRPRRRCFEQGDIEECASLASCCRLPSDLDIGAGVCNRSYLEIWVWHLVSQRDLLRLCS